MTRTLYPESGLRSRQRVPPLRRSSENRPMNRRAILIVSLLLTASAFLLLVFRGDSTPNAAWEHRLPDTEYVHCLATHENSQRPVLVAGIQKNNYGSRNYDNYIVCFDLGTGDEIWRRHESIAGNLRGGKRPTSIEFDSFGDLIVGWDYFAVGEGDYEVVSKLSAKDGTPIWNWTALSEGSRPLGSGYSHGALIFCDGSDILVKTTRSTGTVSGSSAMQEFYCVIDSSTGKAVASSTSSTATAEARWRSKANSLAFIAADGSQVTWGRHEYEHTETNWLKWHKEEGIWMPESHWERRERIQVTRTPSHKSGSQEQFFVGGEQERVLLLVYSDGAPIPSATLLVNMSEEAESRNWRVVGLEDDHKLGRTLAQGVGISHNYGGPVRLTKAGSVIVGGNLLQDQSPQKLTVWKQP
jgi:hypothetical protein